jgi:ketosteroid isomerase-like protein
VSQENVEVVKRAFDAFDRRDVDGLVDLTTAHVEWLPGMPGIVAGDSFRGREGVEQYFEGLAETWVEYRASVEELRDLGDRVLALGRLEGSLGQSCPGPSYRQRRRTGRILARAANSARHSGLLNVRRPSINTRMLEPFLAC